MPHPTRAERRSRSWRAISAPEYFHATEALDAEAENLAATDADEPEERLHLAQSAALLGEQLRRLSAEFREVLVLREIEDLPYREIAEVLGTPIGTVMSRLARARRMMRKALATGDRHEV